MVHGRIALELCPWMAAVLALLALGFAVYSYQEASAFVARGVEVPGVIVRFDERRQSYWDSGSEQPRYRRVYAPVVRFTDATGATHTLRAGSFQSWPFHRTGDQVAVLYDPQRPADVRINSWFELWRTTIVSFMVGVVAAASALGALSASGTKRRATTPT